MSVTVVPVTIWAVASNTINYAWHLGIWLPVLAVALFAVARGVLLVDSVDMPCQTAPMTQTSTTQPPAVAAPFTADQLRQLAFAGDQVRLVSARNAREIDGTRYLYQLAENTWEGDYSGLADALNAEAVRLDNPITD
jgi:pectin methylesterase-like acyl-CoA thioesterase